MNGQMNNCNSNYRPPCPRMYHPGNPRPSLIPGHAPRPYHPPFHHQKQQSPQFHHQEQQPPPFQNIWPPQNPPRQHLWDPRQDFGTGHCFPSNRMPFRPPIRGGFNMQRNYCNNLDNDKHMVPSDYNSNDFHMNQTTQGLRGRGRGGNKFQRGGHHNADKKKNKKVKEKMYDFNCEVCDRGFKTEEKYKEHCDGHEACRVEGCKYVAAPKLVKLHYEYQHRTGMAKKIWQLQSKEEIEKWRQERKKNYPTKENVEQRKKERQARVERGEVIETREFGKMRGRGRGRGRGARGGSRFSQSERPPRYDHPAKRRGSHDEALDQSNATDENRKDEAKSCSDQATSAKRARLDDSSDPLAIIFAAVEQMIDSDSSDFSDDPDSDSAPEERANQSQASSAPTGSDVTNKGGGSKMASDASETAKKGSAGVKIEEISVDGKIKSLEEKENKEGVASTQAKLCTYSESEDEQQNSEAVDSVTAESGQVKAGETSPQTRNATEKDSRQFSGGRGRPGRNERRRGGRGGRVRGRHPANNNRNFRPHTARPNLLQKLLAGEIRHERNVIMQCVRHIVKGGFFGLAANQNAPPQNESNPGDTTRTEMDQSEK